MRPLKFPTAESIPEDFFISILRWYLVGSTIMLVLLIGIMWLFCYALISPSRQASNTSNSLVATTTQHSRL